MSGLDAQRLAVLYSDRCKAGEQICGGAPPDWLVAGFRMLAAGLASSVVGAKEYPGRSKLRKRLLKVSNAARLLMEELEDHIVLGRLWADGDTLFGHAEHHALERIALRAETAVERIGQSAGAGKSWPNPDGNTIAQTCALAVMIAWKEIHGRWPGTSDARAQGACQSLLLAAGGDGERRGKKEPSPDGFWRDQLRHARAHVDSSAARSVQKVVTAGRGAS